MRSKIKGVNELRRILSGRKKAGRKVVFTNGCFDIIHYGHVRYLEDAANKGDILVVGVNSDSSVRAIKGSNRPFVCQADRAKLIAALESVDYVVIFSGLTPINIIKTLLPDVLVKGADWHKDSIVGSNIVLARGGKVYSIPLAAGRSTTAIIEKIAKRCSIKKS